jgi:hypothetical protein
MGANDKQELIILLLLETKFHDREDYHELLKKYDCNKMNDRFNELLDEFLNDYALNNTEKSGKNL